MHCRGPVLLLAVTVGDLAQSFVGVLVTAIGLAGFVVVGLCFVPGGESAECFVVAREAVQDALIGGGDLLVALGDGDEIGDGKQTLPGDRFGFLGRCDRPARLA